MTNFTNGNNEIKDSSLIESQFCLLLACLRLCLYIIEGSTAGANVLRSHLGRTPLLFCTNKN